MFTPLTNIFVPTIVKIEMGNMLLEGTNKMEELSITLNITYVLLLTFFIGTTLIES